MLELLPKGVVNITEVFLSPLMNAASSKQKSRQKKILIAKVLNLLPNVTHKEQWLHV